LKVIGRIYKCYWKDRFEVLDQQVANKGTTMFLCHVTTARMSDYK
jgi:hypothetical protein